MLLTVGPDGETLAFPLVTGRSKLNTMVKLPVPSLRGSTVRLLSDNGISKVPAPPCVIRETAETRVGAVAISVEVNGNTQAPRPRVQTESVVAPRSIRISQIMV